MTQFKRVFSAQLCVFIIGLFCVPAISLAAVVYTEIDKSSKNFDKLEQMHSVAFAAYLNEDYQIAYEKWQEAAKKKHAKSLFNLALMHDRGQVPNGKSSKERALDLYKRSANANYLPAYRYWANMVEKDRPELAKRIRNVLRESLPKTESSSLITGNTNDSNVENSTKNSQKRVVKAEQTAANSFNREQWISQQGDRNWTIQIVAYRNEVQLLNFADQHNLSERAAYFKETTKDKSWYKLILGSFSSKEKAEKARSDLPKSVQSEGPWLRQFKDIKSAILRSNNSN